MPAHQASLNLKILPCLEVSHAAQTLSTWYWEAPRVGSYFFPWENIVITITRRARGTGQGNSHWQSTMCVCRKEGLKDLERSSIKCKDE